MTGNVKAALKLPSNSGYSVGVLSLKSAIDIRSVRISYWTNIPQVNLLILPHAVVPLIPFNFLSIIDSLTPELVYAAVL